MVTEACLLIAGIVLSGYTSPLCPGNWELFLATGRDLVVDVFELDNVDGSTILVNAGIGKEIIRDVVVEQFVLFLWCC